MEEEEEDNNDEYFVSIGGDERPASSIIHGDMNEQIQFLYNLLWFAKTYDHAVINPPLAHGQNQDSDLIFPLGATKFIYSYFTFNSLYNINWQRSVKEGTIVLWDDDTPAKTETPKQTERIESLVLFIFSESVPFNRILKNCAIGNDIAKDLASITCDRMITRESIKLFQRAISYCCNHRNITGDELINIGSRRIIRIITFIYHVRCNIFHGEKNVFQMAEGLQSKRLAIYAKILNGITQTIFDILSDKYKIKCQKPKFKFE